jgi:hypothetical protein
MTTKKHKVSAYLTDDEFEVLKGLATQYQVSQSQIVILAIRELSKLGQVELMEFPVSYLPNAISGVTKEDMELLVKNEVKTAIAQLETKFDDKLGEFKSLVFETAPTVETMNAAIKSNSESGVTKELLETVTEGKPEKKTITEIMPSQDSPITLETDNQDETLINQDKEPEMTVNSLLDGFEVNQATECPFIVGRSYSQQELKFLFKTDYGSDIINWIERKKGTKNPIAQKYSRCFTAKGSGKDKIYVFEGE